MDGEQNRNIFRAVALRHDHTSMVYDHIVEIEATHNIVGAVLEDREIRNQIDHWCADHDALAAISQNNVVWFARETDATLFYLRFS